MRLDFEPRILSVEKVGEMLDAVLQNAEGARLQHWLAAEACDDDAKQPVKEFKKVDREQRRIEAAIADWKAKHLAEEVG